MTAETFIEDAIHFILSAVSKEDLDVLLSKDEDWKQFVNDAKLTREEAKALHEGLKKHGTLTDAELKEMRQQEKEFRERFLKLYPQVKRDVEEHIKQLRALADRADQVHKHCTIANVVARSTGLTSGILTIMGVSMAPFTVGLSLALTGSGLLLGSVATATSVVSTIVEHKNMSSIEAEAKNLKSTGINTDLIGKAIRDNKTRLGSNCKSFNIFKDVARHILALKLARLSPEEVAQNPSLIGKVFGSTAMTMSKGTRISGGVAIGLTILLYVYSIVQDSKDLQEGAVSKSGEKLRQQAQELENMLVELKQFYEMLQQDLIPLEQCRMRG